MFKTKNLTEAAILSSMGVIFQLMPVLFSEIFTIFTLLSTVPIYLITRKHMELGLLAYFVTGTIVFFFNLEECIIFICLNGLVGVLLGSLSKWKALACLIAGIVLSLSILFVNFVIGFPIFGSTLGFKLITIFLIFSFGLIYVTIYFFMLRVMEKRIQIIKFYLNS